MAKKVGKNIIKIKRYQEMLKRELISNEQLEKLKEKGIISDDELKDIIGGGADELLPNN